MATEIQSQVLDFSQDGPSNILLPFKVWIQGQQNNKTDLQEVHAGLETEQIQLRYLHPSSPRWQTKALSGDTMGKGSVDSVPAGGMGQRPYPVMLIRANPISDIELESPLPVAICKVDPNQDVVEVAGHISHSSRSVPSDILAVHINCKPALLSFEQQPTLETYRELERQQAGSGQLSNALSTLSFPSHVQGHSEVTVTSSKTSPNQSVSRKPYFMTSGSLTMPPNSTEAQDDVSTTSHRSSWQTHVSNPFQDPLQSSTGRVKSSSAEMNCLAEPPHTSSVRDVISETSEDPFIEPMRFLSDPTLSNKRTIYDINDNLLPAAESRSTKQLCSETRKAIDRHQHNYIQSIKPPRWPEPQLSPVPLNSQTRNETPEASSCHLHGIQAQLCHSNSLAGTFKLPFPENANTPTYSSGFHAHAISTEEKSRSYFSSNVAFRHIPKRLVDAAGAGSVDEATSTAFSALEHLSRQPRPCITCPSKPEPLDSQLCRSQTSEIPPTFCFPPPLLQMPPMHLKNVPPARETMQMLATGMHHAPVHAVPGVHSSAAFAIDVPSPTSVPFDATPVSWPSLQPVNTKGSTVGPAAVHTPVVVSPLHKPTNPPIQNCPTSLPYLASVTHAASDHVPPLRHWSSNNVPNAHKPVAPGNPGSRHVDHSLYPSPAVSLPPMTSVAMPRSTSSPMHCPCVTPSQAGTFYKYAPSFQSSTGHLLPSPTSEAMRPSSFPYASTGISRSSYLPSFSIFSPQSPEMMPPISNAGAARSSNADLFQDKDAYQSSSHSPWKPPPPHLTNPPLANSFHNPAINTYPTVHCSPKYIPRVATPKHVPRRQNKSLHKRAASKTSNSQQSTLSQYDDSWISNVVQTSFDFLQETVLQSPAPTSDFEKCLKKSHQYEKHLIAVRPGATSKESCFVPGPVVKTSGKALLPPSTAAGSARSLPLLHQQEDISSCSLSPWSKQDPSLQSVDQSSKASLATQEDFNTAQTLQHMYLFKEHSSSPQRAANEALGEASWKELVERKSSHSTGTINPQNTDQSSKASSATQEDLNPFHTLQHIKVHTSSSGRTSVATREVAKVANPALMTSHDEIQPSEECLAPLGRATEKKVSSNDFRCINCNQVAEYNPRWKLTRSDTKVLAKLKLFIVDGPWKMSGLVMCVPCLYLLRILGFDQHKLEIAWAGFRREICRDTILMSHVPRKNFCVHCGGTLLPHHQRMGIFHETCDGWVPADVIFSKQNVLSHLKERQELYLCMQCFQDLASIHKTLRWIKIGIAKFLKKMTRESYMFSYCSKKFRK